MLKNFITISFRSLVRNWNYTVINIAGLCVGLTACLIIFMVVHFEFSFDRFHSNYEQLYRVTRSSTNASGTEYSPVTPYPFAEAFRSDFTEIPLMTQLHHHESVLARMDEEKHTINNVIFADSLFFEVFSFEVNSGNPRNELGTPGKAFITESMAKQTKAHVGSHLKLDNVLDVEVVGIVSDPPSTSHIQFSMVVSMPSLSKEFIGLPIDQWGMNMSGFSYLVIPPAITAATIESQFPKFVEKHYTDPEKNKPVYTLQPLSDVHFNDRYASDTPGGAGVVNHASLAVLSALAIFILLIACVNFINLSTALAVKKSREIGVRKTLGANRSQLVTQYLAEAFLLSLFSALLAVMLTQALLPMLNAFLQKQLVLNLSSGLIPLFLFALVVFTALLAGLYPAFILSGFNPITVLRNKFSAQGSSGAYARKYLVVFQFIVAQVLIIGTLVVANQMEYLRSKPLGFVKDAVVTIPIPDTKKELRESFQQQLATVAGVQHFSFSLGAPTSENNFGTRYYLTERGTTERFDTRIKPADHHYLETFGIELVAGRWFTETDEKQASDNAQEMKARHYAYVVNETLVRQLGFQINEEALGKNITSGLMDINAPIVGVVKDFHTQSLHQALEPVILIPFPYFYYEAGVRMEAAAIPDVLTKLEAIYKQVFPDYVFTYTFLDDHLESLYRQEQRNFVLIQIFAGLAIFISCLGLLGLVSFLTQQKIKEVGVRKVFGASVAQIVVLFSTSFVWLIVAAFAIAVPVAWYVMNTWLEGFAYRVDIGVPAYVYALLSTLLVALLTVCYQSVRAALTNPAKSLRSE